MRKGLKFLLILWLFFKFLPMEAFGEAKNRNILKNSSFTLTTVPGIPDYWNSARTAEWRNDWPDCWQLVNESFIPHTKSIKLSNPRPVTGGERNILRSICFPLDTGKNYTFSVYLKGEPPGAGIEVSLLTWRGKTLFSQKVKVKDKWDRYIFPVSIDSSDLPSLQAYIMFVFSDKGTVWINAPQLEEGDTPTPYIPDTISPAEAEEISLPRSKELPYIKCKVTRSPPLIDGILNDECWEKGTKLTNFFRFGTDKPAKTQTEVYLCRSSDTLFIAFRSWEPSLESIKAKAKKRDSMEIFGDDEVEVFISSEEKGTPYYHFVVNPAGVKYDAQNQDMKWNGDWKVETGREEKAWTAELAIRLHNFSFPEKSSPYWRINFGRHRAAGGKDEWSSFVPMYTSFHTPERFAYLEIMGEDLRDFSIRIIPSIKELPDGSIKPDFEIISLPWGIKKRPFQANFVLYQNGKRQEKITASGIINPGERVILDRMKELKKEDIRKYTYSVYYEFYFTDINKLVNKNMVPDLSKIIRKPEGIYAAFNRSYYTNEEEMKILLNVEESMRNYNLELILLEVSEKGKPIAKRRWSSPLPEKIKWNIRLPEEINKDTKYKLKVRVFSGKDKNIFYQEKEISRFKTPPSPVKIDREKRMLIIDGKYSLPFSIGMDDWSRKIPQDKERAFKDVAEHGFNTITYFFPGTLDKEEIKWILDTSAKFNLKVILSPNFPPMPYPELKKKYLNMVSAFKQHPALLGWIICDEPGPKGNWEKYSGKESDLKDLGKSIKKVDPYHISFCSYAGLWSSSIYGGLEINDIYHMNKYPFGKVPDPLRVMVSLADRMAVDGIRDFKPTSLFLQLYSFFDSPRMLTVAEQTAQTYLMLIHKVRIFHYFNYKPMSVEVWEGMKTLAEEMKFLSSVVSGEEIENWGKSSSTEIHAAFFKKGNRKYLITVNASPKPQRVKFEFSKKPTGKTVRVIFEDRRLPLKGNVLTDKFAPYQRHVYEWE